MSSLSAFGINTPLLQGRPLQLLLNSIFYSVEILYSVKNFLIQYCVIYQNFQKNQENMNIFGGHSRNDENRK